MTFVHIPVLLQEVLQGLNLKSDGIYLDATFGRGGHSRKILEKLGSEGRLYALDRDLEAIEAAKEIEDPRFTIVHSPFSKLKECCDEWGITGKVDGILMDIGVSSPQLDDASRGFSFDRDGPLDMRMDKSASISAATLVNSCSQKELSYIFKVYGEERFASKVASAIVRAREIKPFERTKELSELISKTIPGYEPKHKATRCFQALRIAVNSELDELRQALKETIDVLSEHGRLCVISFHSLEDRIVKNFIKEQAQGQVVPSNIPLTFEQIEKLRLSTATMEPVGGPVKAGEAELQQNVRSRSAILRTCARLPRLKE